MKKFNRFIILFIILISIVLPSTNVVNASSFDQSANEKQINIPVNGFVGNLEENNNSSKDDENKDNIIGSLPQTGKRIFPLASVMSILLIMFGSILVKRGEK
ncbi:hypothetical protein [Clostridium perfringens]|uniref:hypothetical protein n=1 Tax=Clostridium perfringens TaxID=1502 RepID=UPI000D8B9D26|nr:hypothetical protein CYK83_15710 [Clostridium perfringens]HAT4219208.1 hypothetical protein [Clostridium perfringens]HAT4318884.1 hypothetical protein [Clostridium perfringens]